jgi:chemosensory pili system protein ChpC
MATPNTPAKSEEAFGQIVPLDGDALLLPNHAVVEVLGLDEVQLRTDPPAWLLGFVQWRDHELPVISLEGLMGRKMPARSRRTRLLVVNSVGVGLNAGLFALVCQGYPHLATLNRTALQPVKLESRDPDALVLARVRVANALAIIPDLDAVEARLVDMLPIVTAGAAAADWQPTLQ